MLQEKKTNKQSVLLLYDVIFNINVGFGAVIMACGTIYRGTYIQIQVFKTNECCNLCPKLSSLPCDM